MFYEPGKTDHKLPHDPFKACQLPHNNHGTVSNTFEIGLRHSASNRLVVDHLSQRQAQPSSLLPIQQPHLRSTLRHV